jgi:quercetin dioxygenase-like cupin family protein
MSRCVLYESDAERIEMKAIFAAAALLGASASAMQPVQGSAPGVTRADLQRHDLSTPGHEALQARIDIAPGVTAPWHRHPGEEIIYVLEGSLEYQLEGLQPVVLTAGDVLFVPDGVAHKATNVGAGNGAELATYVVEKGKPLLTLAKGIKE